MFYFFSFFWRNIWGTFFKERKWVHRASTLASFMCVLLFLYSRTPFSCFRQEICEYDIDEALAGQYILVPPVSLYIDYLYRHSANIGLLGDFILLYIFWISLHTHTEYMAVELRLYIWTHTRSSWYFYKLNWDSAIYTYIYTQTTSPCDL